MIIRNCMKMQVFSIQVEQTVRDAAKMMEKYHIGTLPVVDQGNKLIGILTLNSLLKIVLPDFVELISHFSYINNLGAFETKIPSQNELDVPISQIMQEPIYVHDDCGLMHAAAILHDADLTDLPVVDSQKHLVGIASHVDIGTAIIHSWDLQ